MFLDFCPLAINAPPCTSKFYKQTNKPSFSIKKRTKPDELNMPLTSEKKGQVLDKKDNKATKRPQEFTDGGGSSSENSLPPPPPPSMAEEHGASSLLPIPIGGGAIAVDGPATGVLPVALGGSSPQKRKAPQFVAPVGVPIICQVCHKSFHNWKALFGHMRLHPERKWRGTFPPPVAQRLLEAQGEENGSQRRVPRDFDLNDPILEEMEELAAAEVPSSSPAKKGGEKGFDLNLLPSNYENDDDDDDDAGVGSGSGTTI
ncbi:hypothetical protein UlMin_039644 [Ulmus minor]